METPNYFLIEHAAGYGLFRLKEFEEIGQILPEVEASQAELSRFSSLVSPVAFQWFTTAEAALENCNALSEGILHSDLLNFLESNVPKKKKKVQTILGISDSKLAAAISESLPHIKCSHSGVVPEVMRGLRTHFESLADAKTLSFAKAQLGLGHSYSRAKVKFDVNRVDNMIIQSIALSDQLDKDINTFGMRIREWYSYHFPELYKVVPDQHQYARCCKVIGDRKQMEEEDVTAQLFEILEDEEKVKEILEVARSSMGMDISPIDLMNVQRFAERVVSLAEYRRSLQGYLKDKMTACAPNLSTLIGDQVGARLISHAGSLTNLAKYPASTVQILGAEKALFRALKTRGNTPKYGLLFHSTYIGRASTKNKGRISRYLANKCSLASRIDCFSEIPVNSFGELLKQQVEDRLKYFDTGDVPKKNLEVMREASALTPQLQAKALKKRKKAAKKAKKALEEQNGGEEIENGVAEEPAVEEPKKKKKRKSEEVPMEVEMNGDAEEVEEGPKKKKKKKKTAA